MIDDTDSGTASTLPVNVAIPGYRLRHQSGSDSLGLWFSAEQMSLGRKVTLKVLHPRLERHEAARREFLAEMDRMAALDHPNLPRVIDTMRDDVLVLVTERVGEKSAASMLEEGKGLTEGVCLRIARGTASALEYLVSNGLAHKNISPGLVAIREDGGARLVTFRNLITLEDLAKLRGKLAQDANYVAPEQLAGEQPIGGKTHSYHVGALLFHLLAKQPPHKGATPVETAKAHLNQEFPSLKRTVPFIAQGVYDLVDACTQRLPDDRPSLAKVAEALEALLDGKDPGISSGKKTGGIVAPKSRRRRRRY